MSRWEIFALNEIFPYQKFLRLSLPSFCGGNFWVLFRSCEVKNFFCRFPLKKWRLMLLCWIWWSNDLMLLLPWSSAPIFLNKNSHATRVICGTKWRHHSPPCFLVIEPQSIHHCIFITWGAFFMIFPRLLLGGLCVWRERRTFFFLYERGAVMDDGCWWDDEEEVSARDYKVTKFLIHSPFPFFRPRFGKSENLLHHTHKMFVQSIWILLTRQWFSSFMH